MLKALARKRDRDLDLLDYDKLAALRLLKLFNTFPLVLFFSPINPQILLFLNQENYNKNSDINS